MSLPARDLPGLSLWLGRDMTREMVFSTEHPWGGFCSILCSSCKDAALAGTACYAGNKVQNPNALAERRPWDLLTWRGLTPSATSVPCPDGTSYPCHRSSSPAFPMKAKAWICFKNPKLGSNSGFGGAQHAQSRSPAEGPESGHELPLSQQEDLSWTAPKTGDSLDHSSGRLM